MSKVIEQWKFVRGTLTAHSVTNEALGRTVCKRSGLKFEPAAQNVVIDDKYKCITCKKSLAKMNTVIRSPCKEGGK